jgi:hypothetical protein
MTLIPELERELTHAIRLHARGARRAWWRRVPLLASLATMLLGTAVALAATGVIRFGAPESVPGTPRIRPASPTSGLGIVRAGGSRLLALRAADPAGGLPWGMRVAQTTRGLGCVTVGRVLDGKLGALGIDGAFANDGRFHPLPVGLTSGPESCAPLDASGELFIAVSESDVPTSGSVFRRCYPPGMVVGARPSELCAESEERNLYYGLLGPQATSISYRYRGAMYTIAPEGPQGAYLIVMPTTGRDDFNGATSALMPTNSPISRIAYRGGLVCRFSSAEGPAPAGNCRTPAGYEPAPTPHPTSAELRTPIDATATASRTAAWSITVTFRARVAIENALDQYTVELHSPGTPRALGFGATASNLRTGQQAKLTFSNLTRPGVYTGTVTFTTAQRPGARGFGGTLVGRFRTRIP